MASLERHEIALKVYRDKWNDFYKWEVEVEWSTLVNGLTDHCHPPPPVLPDTSHAESGEMDLDGEEDACSTLFIFQDQELQCEQPLDNPVEKDAANFKSYPPYTICTPLTQNTAGPRLDSTSFIPYADDHKFRVDAYLSLFPNSEHLGWQADFKDPDHEVIKLETARHLFYDKGFGFDEIENIPGFDARLRIDDCDGLVWASAQRDLPFIHWYGINQGDGEESSGVPAPSTTKFIPSSIAQLTDGSAGKGLFAEVQKASGNFCPHLNCLKSYFPHCRMHGVPPIQEQRPKKPLAKFADGQRCGDFCYRRIPREHRTHEELVKLGLDWTQTEIALLSDILKLSPDSSPCDLAVICRKPCMEVLATRCRIHPDPDVLDYQVDELEGAPAAPTEEWFRDNRLDRDGGILAGNDLYHPLQPCSHPGPCGSQESNCPCYKARHHCSRNCRCSMKCRLRRKGCKCGRNQQRNCCQDEYPFCPCRLNFIECDPELCTSCDARVKEPKGKKSKCRNNACQKGRFPLIEINAATWGQGAFAGRSIKSGTIIGEYVGEALLLAEADEGVQSLLNRYSGLNYSFSLDQTFLLDSLRAGNETRFLNHTTDANCTADVITVNGDHRIFLISTKAIKKGQELFLDYGEAFWKDGEDDESQAQPKDPTTRMETSRPSSPTSWS
ncbi:Setd1a protein [Coprinopsis cinerea AmutBmut pab1-1]|nr:Setd1a protein [Coprinopsis cinerea AmutBmut pab1-1]